MHKSIIQKIRDFIHRKDWENAPDIKTCIERLARYYGADEYFYLSEGKYGSDITLFKDGNVILQGWISYDRGKWKLNVTKYTNKGDILDG